MQCIRGVAGLLKKQSSVSHPVIAPFFYSESVQYALVVFILPLHIN